MTATLARHARRLLAAPHRAQAAVLGGEEELDARAAAGVVEGLSELEELGEPASPRELLELLAGLEVTLRDHMLGLER